MAENKNTKTPSQEYQQKIGTSFKQDKGPSLSQSRRELDEQYKTSQEQTGPSLAESEEEQAYLYQLELARAQERMRQDEENTRMEEESQKPVPMGIIFFGFLIILCLIADIIDIFTGGTIGWVIGLFVDFILLILTGISKSGRKQFKRILAGIIGDSIPIVAFLPLRSIFLIWAFISSRSTKLQAVGQVAGKAALAHVSRKEAEPRVERHINPANMTRKRMEEVSAETGIPMPKILPPDMK